jgi:molecular chaperone GrpE
MTDRDRQPEDTSAAAGEPVVSKPYIMPDDPEPGSVELLQKEVAEARDRMLRTLAEMENLRKRTSKEVADSKLYGITGYNAHRHHDFAAVGLAWQIRWGGGY